MALSSIERIVSFKSLIKYDRAVRVVSRKTHGRSAEFVYVTVQLAGKQNDDGSARLITIGFKDQLSAKNSAGSLLSVLRDGLAQGWIDSDFVYNQVCQKWADMGLKKIGERNQQLLTEAEESARTADAADALVDVRGMSLKDYLIAWAQKIGLFKEREETREEASEDGHSNQ